MTGELQRLIRRLRDDRVSGASELVAQAVSLLDLARRGGPDTLAEAAEAVRSARRSMAPLLNLAAAALAEPREPGALERFERRWRAAGPALVRAATASLLRPGGERFVTFSFSGSVLACLRALAGRAALKVACAEGRPGMEGRRMAAELARAGAAVELFTDAALGHALPGADGLLLGADAVAPSWFLNKVGSRALAAASQQAGTRVYVLATSDKFLDEETAAGLDVEEHDATEVWELPPPGVVVRNPYFERVPLELVTGVITDAPCSEDR